MRTKKMPRALEDKFGEKISLWLHNLLDLTDDENFKERLFSLIRLPEAIQYEPEERSVINEVLSRMLSITFIIEKYKEELEDFYSDYND